MGDLTAIEKLIESITRTILVNRKMSRILNRHFAKLGVAIALV